MNAIRKTAGLVVLWATVAALNSGCATSATRQFVPLEASEGKGRQYRVYVMRHKAPQGYPECMQVRCNDQLVGALGYDGYLTWMCDAKRKYLITWGWGPEPQGRLQLFRETDDEIFVDIHPGYYGKDRIRLNAAEGRSLLAGKPTPAVVGRGYSLVEDSSVSSRQGYVEFYEPNDSRLWSTFTAQRQGADESDLKRTEVNPYLPASQFIFVPQRLRIASPPGQQTFVMSCSHWSQTTDVVVKEGYVTPVSVNVLVTAAPDPDATIRNTMTRQLVVNVSCESPVEVNEHNKRLLCQ